MIRGVVRAYRDGGDRLHDVQGDDGRYEGSVAKGGKASRNSWTQLCELGKRRGVKCDLSPTVCLYLKPRTILAKLARGRTSFAGA